METVKRVYGGRTAEERDAGRRTALIDAAFALVAEDGWRALRIETVCRAAGLNKRYFYEAFSDLDALVAAVTAKLADDAITTTLDALPQDAEHPAWVRAGVGALLTHLTEDPRRARVLFGAVAADDAASGHRADALRRVIGLVAIQGRDIHHLRDDDPIIGLTAAIIVGGTGQAVLDWLDGRIAYTEDDFADRLTALWLSLSAAAAANAT